MSDKSALAVSQLASEIAEKITHDERLVQVIGKYSSEVKVFAEVLSAALSEREEKVAKLKRAADVAIDKQIRGRDQTLDRAMDNLLKAIADMD